MAVAHIVEPSPVTTGQPPRKRWTRAECEKLEMYGLIDGHHYELVEGELIDTMGKNRPHTVVCMLLMRWLGRAISDERGQLEGAIDVSPADHPTSEPQPDVALLAQPVESFLDRNPTADQVQLLIEVADTSLAFDTGVKARLYARAAIADYWVVDIHARRLLVFRNPVGNAYQTITAYDAQESVSPLAAPQAALRIADILPIEN